MIQNLSATPLLDQFQVTKSTYAHQHRCDYSVYPRPFSSIVLITEGKCEFTAKDTAFSATAADTVLIPAGTKYVSTWVGTPNIVYLCIHFNFANRFADYAPQNFALQKINFESSIVRDTLEFLRANIQNEGFEPLAAMSGFYSFYSQILKTLKPAVRTFAWEQVKNAVTYLEYNVAENPTVNELAKLCALSEPYFYDLFKKALGCTPVIYKNNVKVRHAMNLLSGDAPVSQIAETLGFASEQYFRETFRNFTGKSPTVYRRGLIR